MIIEVSNTIQLYIYNYIYLLLEIGTILLGLSGLFYIIGIFLFFDKAFLLMSNLLFLIGLYLLLGLVKMTSIFNKKIKGTVAYFIGFFLIIIGFKVIGVLIQLYSIYEFFKTIAISLLSYLVIVPGIGQYIQRFIENNKGYAKKNDINNQV